MRKKAGIFIASTLILSYFSGACVPIAIEESAASPIAVFTSTIIVTETAEPIPPKTSENKQVPTKSLEAFCRNEGALGYTLSAEETWGTLDDNIEHLSYCYKRTSLSIEGATNRDVILSSFIEQGAFDGDFPSEYPSADAKLGVPVKVYFKEGSELSSKLDVVAMPAPVPKATFTPQESKEYDRPTAEVGFCPVDLDVGWKAMDSGFGYSEAYGGYHEGIDLYGPAGLEFQSPHYCKVDSIFVRANSGGHGVWLYCPGLPVNYFLFYHVNLRFNNYNTLEHYGIPKDTFFTETGAPIRRTASPIENFGFMEPGQPIHVYMGRTDSSSVHLHIEAHKEKYSPPEDPCLYLDCCDE